MKPNYRMEADARVVIDNELALNGWDKSQIWRESAPPGYTDKLKGKKPDYVLCYKDSHKPIAVIEAKAPSKNLEKALQQGLEYAKLLECPVVFASDGVLTLTAHIQGGEPLIINNEEVRGFLNEKALLNFVNSRIWSQGEVIRHSRDLIKIFGQASKKLREEGLVNIDAFVEFSQILFFKLFSELADADDERAKNLPVHWRDIKGKVGDNLLSSYKNALEKLSDSYEGVFIKDTEIKIPLTLESIVTSLEKYSFASIKADIKGEAYEYFLRQYNKEKSELAQYFTPRHVVAAMVAMCNPKLGEKVFDPFCGTGGMLIEAFRHINKNLNKQDKSKIQLLRENTIFGMDASRTASAAKMNMILAGDGHSGINRGNSLKNPVNGEYDIVITNIPFVKENEEEFITYCFNAVKERPNGRVCMIVPERILDADKYADLRKEILKKWTIKRVVSLPRELFGATTAKTSIIYALWGDGHGNEKQASKKVREFIPYFEVKNDGFTLDKKRDTIPGKNDLDVVIETRNDEIKEKDFFACAENNFAFKPKENMKIEFNYATVPLGDLVSVKNRKITITSDMMCLEPGFIGKEHRIFLKEERYGFNVKTYNRKRILPGDLVFARLHTQNGLFAFSDGEYHGTGTHLVCEVDETKINKDFLFWVLHFVVPTLSMVDTVGRETYKEEDILALPIPLPTLKEQEKLIDKVKPLQAESEKVTADLTEEKQKLSDKLLSF